MRIILCNPVLVNSLTYFGALVITVLLPFLKLPKLPYPAGTLLKQTDFEDEALARYVGISLWAFHFLRRTLEVLFVHIYKRKMPLSETVGAPIYYWGFATWMGWSLQKSTFHPPFTAMFLTGAIFFVLGEAGNCYCHIRLRLFRTRQYPLELVSLQTGHVLPHGFLFNWVSCPHYLCEILSWLGYFLVVFTMPSLFLLLATVMTLVIYARKKHNMYLTEFDGKENRPAYPRRRTTLIPLLF